MDEKEVEFKQNIKHMKLGKETGYSWYTWEKLSIHCIFIIFISGFNCTANKISKLVFWYENHWSYII